MNPILKTAAPHFTDCSSDQEIAQADLDKGIHQHNKEKHEVKIEEDEFKKIKTEVSSKNSHNKEEETKKGLGNIIEVGIVQKPQEKTLNGLCNLTNDIVNRKTLSSSSDSVISDSSSENEEMINLTKKDLNSNKENNEELSKKRKCELEKSDSQNESCVNKKSNEEAECLQSKKICIKQHNENDFIVQSKKINCF